MSIIVSMGIAKDIKRELKKRGWSQYKLAQESGLSNAKISDLVTKDRDAQMSTLVPLAKGFGITIDELIANPKPVTKIRGKSTETKEVRQCLKDFGLEPEHIKLAMGLIGQMAEAQKAKGKAATG